MTERITIASATESPWDPKLRLADIFRRKTPGLQIQEERFVNPETLLENKVILTVESTASQQVEEWEKVAATRDFFVLEQATSGNISFFQDCFISSEELIVCKNSKGFHRFYNFVRALAYQRTFDEFSHWGTLDQIRDLKLQSRKDWAPTFSFIQRKFATNYVNSLLTRLYNLVTTGEEKASVWDRFLDRVY